jgi:iron complex outermembrane recepter protein
MSDTLRIDSVTVTGTSLRGFAPESSPLQVFDREEILGSGAGSTNQFMRTLAQNFSGGSTEFAASQGLPNDSNSQFNSTFGTGANLRGLGSRDRWVESERAADSLIQT